MVEFITEMIKIYNYNLKKTRNKYLNPNCTIIKWQNLQINSENILLKPNKCIP